MKCYLASPFFVSQQRERVEKVRTELLKICEVFSPMHDGVMITEKASMRALHVAYAENIGSIVSSDFIFAIMDYDDIEFSGELYGKTDKPKERIFHGFDSGTAFEIGMAVAYGKPVVAYIPSGVKLNLMLSLATKGYTTNIDAVKDLVNDIIIQRRVFRSEAYAKITFEDKGLRFT